MKVLCYLSKCIAFLYSILCHGLREAMSALLKRISIYSFLLVARDISAFLYFSRVNEEFVSLAKNSSSSL